MRPESNIIRAVFVHLGESPCKHLWLNIERHLEIFPHVPVHLVINSRKHLRKIPKGCGVIFLDKSFIDESFARDRDLVFRRGFWSHTLSRLFVLKYVHEKYPDSALLHIESDVLLLPDFPWEKLQKINRLAWQQYNEDRDVASLLYIPNEDSSKIFNALLEQELLLFPGHTDMSILKAIHRKKTELTTYLPIVSKKIPDLLNKNSVVTASILEEDATNSLAEDGIFDSAAIGMWLLGHDPRNTYGRFLLHEMSPIHSGDTPISPDSVYYQILQDGRLKISDRTNRSHAISVWSLHVHSKERELFSTKWISKLQEYATLANMNPEPLHKWRLASVYAMFIDSVWTRTPHKFFLGFPSVHRFRRLVVDLRGKWLNGRGQ
jgi:hypothetical protein